MAAFARLLLPKILAGIAEIFAASRLGLWLMVQNSRPVKRMCLPPLYRVTAWAREWVFRVDRFLSNAVNKIDAKGRVSVPAQFRTVLQTRALSDLYALQPIDTAAIDAGGLDLLERYEARLAQNDPFLQTSDDISFFCHGDGAFLKLDASGRIQVTDFIREHTGITDEIAFVGRGQFFQMWEPKRFAEHRMQVRERLRQMRSESANPVKEAGQ